MVCMQSSDTGPCNGYYNRWFFDSGKLTCVQFAYGGCRGNHNNFLTFQECMNTCSVVKGQFQILSISVSHVKTFNFLDALSGTQIRKVSPAASQLQLNEQSPQSAVDCMVSPWSPWSACSASCGIGFEERFRFVKIPARYGGKSCPTNLKKRRRCYGPIPCY